jgi:hypothetical protein
MIIVLKGGASNEKNKKLGKRLVARKRVTISMYCGKIKLKEDPLLIQNVLRHEWS